MYKLTLQQKELLVGKMFADDSYFAPTQDINGDWFISKEEIDQCVVEEFLWVKDLEESGFIPKEVPFI